MMPYYVVYSLWQNLIVIHNNIRYIYVVSIFWSIEYRRQMEYGVWSNNIKKSNSQTKEKEKKGRFCGMAAKSRSRWNLYCKLSIK